MAVKQNPVAMSMTEKDWEITRLYIKAAEGSLSWDEMNVLSDNRFDWSDWDRVIPNLSTKEMGILLRTKPWLDGNIPHIMYDRNNEKDGKQPKATHSSCLKK